jgi:hypothetical protein
MNVSAATSSYFLVAMATQRANSVTRPHHVTRLYTTRRVRFVILAIVFFFFFLSWYSHLLYGLEVKSKGSCTSKDANYDNFLVEFAKADAIVSYWFPLLLLIIANAVLTRKLRESTTLPTESVNATPESRRVRKVNSVTLTAVAVSLAYIVLTMPYSVYMATSYFSTGAVAVTEDLVQKMLFLRYGLVVVNFNYAVNFFISTVSPALSFAASSFVCWSSAGGKGQNSRLNTHERQLIHRKRKIINPFTASCENAMTLSARHSSVL